MTVATKLTTGGSDTDQTNYLVYGSLSLKLNTFDFALLDPASAPAVDDNCKFTFSGYPGLNPSGIPNVWFGNVKASHSRTRYG